jgi:hypothetical protein
VEIKTKNMKLFIVMMCLIFSIGCVKSHKFTSKVCDGKFYVEVFYVPIGSYKDYLTDSSNFRVYAGMLDADHEVFSFTCKGDSLKIDKSAENDMGLSWQSDSVGRSYLKGDTMRIIESKVFNIEDLKKNKWGNNNPLFPIQ